ncbi:MFS transporter [Verrucomicrobia bacterium]|nr:MFS transporter [Verrucomicrobiota bacterium]
MKEPKSTLTTLGVIGALYFSQGIPNGFFRQTVPVIFRENGLSLEQIALFYPVLFIPWMLKFLWAPLVERFHSINQGKYRSWIIPLQLIIAGVMCSLAFWEIGGPIGFFIIGVFFINIFSSMQDVSIDGHSITLLKFSERGWGNSVQVGTFWFGYIIGGGLMLILFSIIGWNNVFFLMAFVYLISMIPIFLNKTHRTNQNETNDISKKNWSSIISFLKQPQIALILFIVSAYRIVEGFIRSILPAMLKDWGMDFSQIGLALGIIAPTSVLLGAIVAGHFINRLGRIRSLLVFGLLQVISALGYMLLSIYSDQPTMISIIPFIMVDHFISGLVTVALFSSMMDWSRKNQPGSDYTCMDCMGVFAMMFGAGISYYIAAKWGYSTCFIIALPLTVLSIFVVWRLYNKVEKNRYWKPLNEKSTLEGI